MKKLLLAAVACCALFSSCKTYQLNVVSTRGKTPDERTGDYKFENDSVRITYSFYGENAPVNVNVYNKLNQPLYVDWQKSAIIIGDKAISYAANKVTFNGDINAESYKYRSYYNNGVTTNPTYTSGTLSGTAELPRTSTFLPPHTQSNNTTLYLTKDFLKIPDDSYVQTKLRTANSNGLMFKNVKSAGFTPENSPLAFRSYITTYTLVDGKPMQAVYEQSFFVSRTIKTSINPNSLHDFSRKRGDYFINTKASKAITIIGASVVGAIAVAGFVAVATQPTPKL